MKAAINVSMIVIGDEILNGRTADLNGSWLAKFLFANGLHFKSLRFIHDDQDEIKKAIADSMNESEIIITSGGIGPTKDDKTKSVLAEYFFKKITPNNDVAKIVTQNYNQFGRSWTPEQNHYHYFPEDFIATNNPKGLAPGICYFDKDRNKLILSGPGVPREFSEIVEKEFLPLIKKHYSKDIKEFYQTVIRTKSIPEEKIFFELCPTLWSQLEVFGKVSSLPHTIGIDIVVGYSSTIDEHEKKQKEINELIKKSPLEPYVWQYGNRAINELVLECALKKNVTIALAESCTGGLTASKITDLSGSSSIFMGGIVSYSNLAKSELLEVDPTLIEKFGAVSLEVAEAMALGALTKFHTDYAVSLTGIAGPSGGSEQKPAGTVAIGFASKKKSGAKLFQFPGDRIRRKERFSDMALLMLYELIIN